jgi:hypothetical protein
VCGGVGWGGRFGVVVVCWGGFVGGGGGGGGGGGAGLFVMCGHEFEYGVVHVCVFVV